ncbi:MAG: protein kinase [Nitrospirales bacterium]
MNSTPAHCLQGKELRDGWMVTEMITRKPTSTGGKFSVGYKVQSKVGQEAFLKALDFSAAINCPDPARELQHMTEAYNFERDVLSKCKHKKLRRVMTPILDGSIIIDGFGIYSPVYYLIFDLAIGDIRDVITESNNFDLAWCLRSLHNAAVGIQQLHGIGIAHQDLKPSNIIVMNANEQKIGDLGKASDKNLPSNNDFPPIPGDRSYAPPDLFYRDTGVDGFEKRFLADLYMLGSLFYFYFARVSAFHDLICKLQGLPIKRASFKEDIPYFQHAFEESINGLTSVVKETAGDLSEDIIDMIKQLCDPDPNKRGDPLWKHTIVPRYDLQRYISKLELLCRKAEMRLR